MKTVYIDESGYTGAALLNQDQPFQAASAIAICEDDARRLATEFFPNLQASELKYGQLARRKSNWPALLNLQRTILTDFTSITYICDKRFVLALHFLDYAVEPYYFERGVNFYEDGQNYSMASLVYTVGNTLLGSNGFDEILELFQYAMKTKSDLAVSALVEKVKHSNWQNLGEVFGPLAIEDGDCLEAIKAKGTSTDAAFVVLLSLISRLEVVMNEPYSITHDRSDNLLQYNKLLKKFIEHTDAAEFRNSALTALKFPLLLTSVEQVDSKLSSAIQLADILVGGIIDAAKSASGVKVNTYNEQILSLYRENQLIHLLPSIDFEENKVFRKGSQASEMIDYFAQNFSG